MCYNPDSASISVSFVSNLKTEYRAFYLFRYVTESLERRMTHDPLRKLSLLEV